MGRGCERAATHQRTSTQPLARTRLAPGLPADPPPAAAIVSERASAVPVHVAPPAAVGQGITDALRPLSHADRTGTGEARPAKRRRRSSADVDLQRSSTRSVLDPLFASCPVVQHGALVPAGDLPAGRVGLLDPAQPDPSASDELVPVRAVRPHVGIHFGFERRTFSLCCGERRRIRTGAAGRTPPRRRTDPHLGRSLRQNASSGSVDVVHAAREQRRQPELRRRNVEQHPGRERSAQQPQAQGAQGCSVAQVPLLRMRAKVCAPECLGYTHCACFARPPLGREHLR